MPSTPTSPPKTDAHGHWMASALLAILILGTAAFLAYEATTLFVLVPNVPREKKVVFIRPGSSVREIAMDLGQEGILTSGWKFRFLAKFSGKERSLKGGEYELTSPMSPSEIIRTLSGGRTILHAVTLPEGLTMRDMTHVLASEHLVNEAQFTALLTDPTMLSLLKIPAPSFEGFLFPDTYSFTRTDGERKILAAMVERFRKVIRPEDEARAKALGWDLLKWVTMASIIEKESSVVDEQPIVSSVFHNRLKKKMRLQSDPTVIYGIPDYNGNITKKDLLTPTPYNTYTQSGLPPGPIANPGATALRAAVYPAETDYLYFVSKRDGTHAFSETYEEHLKYVTEYQLRKEPLAKAP